jgi:hypothetical protein
MGLSGKYETNNVLENRRNSLGFWQGKMFLDLTIKASPMLGTK